jgi:hypothetical protein
MKRTTVLATAVAGALATAGVLAVSGGAAQAPSPTTINLVSKNCRYKIVDNAPKITRRGGPGPGDGFGIACRVENAAGALQGTLDATGTITRGGKSFTGPAEGIYKLGDGEIYLMARLNSSNDTSGVVVGGTGAYTGARGTFTSVDRPGTAGGDPSDDTITLLP